MYSTDGITIPKIVKIEIAIQKSPIEDWLYSELCAAVNPKVAKVPAAATDGAFKTACSLELSIKNDYFPSGQPTQEIFSV